MNKLVLCLVIASVCGAARSAPAAVELYVASFGGGQIQRYDGLTGGHLGALPSPGFSPSALTFGPDGHLYAASWGPDSIFRFDGSTGTLIDQFVPDGTMDLPRGMIFGPGPDIFVTNVSGSFGRLTRYHGATGTHLGDFVPAGSGGLQTAAGLAFGAGDAFYISSFETDQVLRYSAATGQFLDVFSEHERLHLPNGLTFGPDGHLYVGSANPVTGDGEVLRFNGVSGAYMDAFATGGDMGNPSGLAFGPDGHLYVTSSAWDPVNFTFSGSVKRYNGTSGTYIDTFVGGNTLNEPWGLVFNTTRRAASVPAGAQVPVEVGGGSTTPNGVDVVFSEVTTPGVFRENHFEPDDVEPDFRERVAALGTHTFAGVEPQVWDLSFDGTSTGPTTVSIGYDPEPLGTLSADDIVMLHHNQATGSIDVIDPIAVDGLAHILTFQTTGFSTFALGAIVPEPSTQLLVALGMLAGHLRRGRRRG